MSKGNEKIALFVPVNLPEMEKIALDVMRSGQIAAGPMVDKFEKEFANIVKKNHVVLTNDMTSALVLALKLSGVKSGDKVATLAFSCLSTNSAISIVGAEPVWIDINPKMLSMCPEDLERNMSKKIKAVLLYHIAGYPAETSRIASICRANGVKLIEDCNNSLGASTGGNPVGCFGDFSVYSFYPNRQINGFEGGAVVCPDELTENHAKKLRRFGVDYKKFRDHRGEIDPKCDVPEIGISASFSHLNAAVSLAQLPTLPERQARAVRNANRLRKGLIDINEIRMIPEVEDNIPSYWVFLIYAEQRDNLLKILKINNINASILHQRNDIYTGFSHVEGDLKGTSYVMENIIAIPCGWWLEDENIDFVVKNIREFYIN